MCPCPSVQVIVILRTGCHRKKALKWNILVNCSQKWPFWLISTMYTFGNNETSLVRVLYEKFIHSKHTLLNNLLTQYIFTYFCTAILIFCLNLSCHATMNIWINYINNEAVAIGNLKQKMSSMFFISNKRGQCYISIILMCYSDTFAKYGWGVRIFTCKNWTSAFLNK